MICKKCGYKFSGGKFCPECGEKHETDIVSEKDINVDVKECVEEIKDSKDDDIENKKKTDKQAIISLVLGILSWIGILTVIIPLVCGVWSIVDGVKALRGGTKHKKSAIAGCILSVLILVFYIGVIASSNDMQDVSNTNPTEIEMTNGIEADVKVESEKDSSENTEETPEIIVSGDLYTDVENGVLYSNENGKITDVNGRILDTYNYLMVLENGAISDGECILEGVFAGAGGKLVIDMPGGVAYEDEVVDSRLEQLRKKANKQGCATDVIDTGYWLDLNQTIPDTEVADDGSYFDEVVLEAWFDEYGYPIAASLPDTLSWAMACHDGNDTALLDRYYFIDGERFSMDTLKRKSPNDLATYAMILVDIQKMDSGSGDVYFQGIDYISQTPVVVHGDFSGLLNGDDILLFAEFTGLASDDTPNFNGIYIEIINALNIGQ